MSGKARVKVEDLPDKNDATKRDSIAGGTGRDKVLDEGESIVRYIVLVSSKFGE